MAEFSSESEAENGRSRDLVVATYNVHQFRGTDQLHSPERIAAAVEYLDADIIGLQEVDSQPGAESRIRYLQEKTGFEAVFGPAMEKLGADYGNLILSRFPILSSRRLNLSYRKREPRGALDVSFNVDGRRIRLLVAHLGLNRQERFWQIEKLIRTLQVGSYDVEILMGDLNEWWPFSRNLSRLDRFMGKSSTVRSYPSRFPLLALDRIWVRPSKAVGEIVVVQSLEVRSASDHLPVRARLDLKCCPGTARK